MSRFLAMLIAAVFSLGTLPAIAQAPMPADKSAESKMDKDAKKAERKAKKDQKKAERKAKKDAKKAEKEAKKAESK